MVGLTFGQGMALVRIGFGLYFLIQAFTKITGNWLSSGEPLTQFLTPLLQRNQPEALYRPFLEGVVVPNAVLFSQLVALGELTTGLLLVLGLFTRLGSLIGIWLTLNYMVMKGLLNGQGSVDRLFALVCLVLLLTSAGLVWGLDGYLARIWASNPLTRWIAGLTGPRLEHVPSTY